MAAIASDPVEAREFARSVVDRLRADGHEALWAGGCVRDELLGRTPADYDVATSARPDDVRTLFGRSRTLAVGAAFGVITVVGRRGSGQVEVTTFRTDAASIDGRHPAAVAFSTAAEDAKRRDFTINGLFMDPRTGAVHDHVGGRADLEAGIVRAIGVPALRFGEDHLRMLRAVRFAAGFGFALDAETRAAIERLAPLAATVSPERIAAELRAMLSRSGRGRALELLAETRLAPVVLPELTPPEGPAEGPARPDAAWLLSARVVEALDEPSLEAALAILAEGERAALPRVVARLRLSNREGNGACWLRAALDELAPRSVDELPINRPWSSLQPWLAHRDAPRLADLLRARAAVGGHGADFAAWATACLLRSRAELDPPPLLGGHDLIRAGCDPGPALGEMLVRIRALQLDGTLTSPAEALAWLAQRRAPG